MDTNLYRYVIAAAEAGSLSAAARNLYISQPALTKQIAKLENRLGQQLFIRTRNSFEITSAGVLFLEYARKIVELEDTLLQEVTIPDSSEEIIGVATTHRGGTYAARYSSAFYKIYPHVMVDMRNLTARGCEESLEEEQNELAIYTTPVLSDYLEYVELSVDQLYLVVPTKYGIFTPEELAAARTGQAITIDPKRIQNPRFLWYTAPKGQGLYHGEKKIFAEMNYKPSRVHCVEFVDTRYSMAAVGNGIVLMPSVTIHKEDLESGTIARCILEGISMTRSVVIARKKGRKLSKYAEIYWKFMISQNQAENRKENMDELP